MVSNKYHPLILAFEETQEKAFPLIIVIGREPNVSTVCDKSIGHFDFRQFPRCAFWNTAISVFGKFIGKTTFELKQEFIHKKSSPIVFTDALASGIKNEVADKFCLREQVSELEFNQQVEDIFAHSELIRRTSLIILSGLSNDKIYGSFKKAILKKTDLLSIEVKEVPFFYPTNSKRIFGELAENQGDLLKSIYNAFTIEEN